MKTADYHEVNAGATLVTIPVTVIANGKTSCSHLAIHVQHVRDVETALERVAAALEFVVENYSEVSALLSR